MTNTENGDMAFIECGFSDWKGVSEENGAFTCHQQSSCSSMVSTAILYRQNVSITVAGLGVKWNPFWLQLLYVEAWPSTLTIQTVTTN